MSKFNKSVTVEDESNSDIELMHKNDVETAQKSGQTNFEANFGCMSVEMLKFLCHEIGVSDTGNESRKRNVLSDLDISVKGKVVDIDSVMKEVSGKGSKLGFELEKAFANVFNNVLVDSENLTSGAVLEMAYVVRVADENG
ncbi:16052_t:CDS:2 [Racocetra fulgida]|uniref:16052_t:CDS:1 n=1 Tax=Racocetra fulgida TaxID=60492 RepID=A0A9N9B5Q3_9GLOM|nr:16052_t:CDS:2 [Racocetra fulgida]